MMEEKRKFPRYNYQLEVEYYPKGNNIIYSQSTSKNISNGGICFPVLSRLVRAGDLIKLYIYPNRERRNPVPVSGEVIWTKETSDASSHQSVDAEAGIKFTEVNSEALEKILQTVK